MAFFDSAAAFDGKPECRLDASSEIVMTEWIQLLLEEQDEAAALSNFVDVVLWGEAHDEEGAQTEILAHADLRVQLLMGDVIERVFDFGPVHGFISDVDAV